MRAALLLFILASVTPVAVAQGTRAQAGTTFDYEILVKDVVWGHLLEGDFLEVGGIAFEPRAGELYVTDIKNALLGIYDEEGVPLFAFGGSTRFADPRVVQAAPEGTIYVLDNDSTAVKVFNYRGEPSDSIFFPAPPDSPPVERIRTFVRDSDGTWYVADADLPRVIVYGPDLVPRFVLPREDDVGEFELITGIAVSKDGLIAVIDHKAAPVQIFDQRGRFVSGFGQRDIGLDSFSAPVAVAFDEEGYVYVVDMLRHDVKIFDSQGNFQYVFGGWFTPETRGRGPGEMLYPSGIAIAPGGYVYVSERFGNRVQLFERRPREAPPERPAGR